VKSTSSLNKTSSEISCILLLSIRSQPRWLDLLVLLGVGVLPVRSKVGAELERRRAPETRVQVDSRVSCFVLPLVDCLLEGFFAEAALKGSLEEMLHAEVRAESGFRRTFLPADLAGDVFRHLLVAVQMLLHAVLVLDVVTAQVALDFHDFGCVSVRHVISETRPSH
jgi:hypothetical protein